MRARRMQPKVVAPNVLDGCLTGPNLGNGHENLLENVLLEKLPDYCLTCRCLFSLSLRVLALPLPILCSLAHPTLRILRVGKDEHLEEADGSVNGLLFHHVLES